MKKIKAPHVGNVKASHMQKVNTSSGNLYVSPVPSIMDLNDGPAFDIIWNLAEEFAGWCETERYFAEKVLCGNIEDYNIPKDLPLFLKQLGEVVNCLRGGGTVLIHCFAGHGRTGTALAAVKCELDKMPAEQALNFSKSICNGPERKIQRDFVKSLFD